MRVRLPWPWEGHDDPLAEVASLHPGAVVKLPEAREVPPELRARVVPVTYGKGEVRRGMAGLERRLREAGASPEYARTQAARVAPVLERNGGRA